MTRVSGLICALVLLATPAAAARDSQPGATIQAFTQRVNGYLELRQRVVKSVPPLELSSDPHSIHLASHELARALRKARADATAGDIITAEVADLFRRRIANALRDNGMTVGMLLQDLLDEAPPTAAARPKVNGRFDWTRAAAMPGFIIAALPPLPDELQYRFVDEDLVLLDCDAGLIVDVLPHALLTE